VFSNILPPFCHSKATALLSVCLSVCIEQLLPPPPTGIFLPVLDFLVVKKHFKSLAGTSHMDTATGSPYHRSCALVALVNACCCHPLSWYSGHSSLCLYSGGTVLLSVVLFCHCHSSFPSFWWWWYHSFWLYSYISCCIFVFCIFCLQQQHNNIQYTTTTTNKKKKAHI
jgi:hypothetical protein